MISGSAQTVIHHGWSWNPMMNPDRVYLLDIIPAPEASKLTDKIGEEKWKVYFCCSLLEASITYFGAKGGPPEA
jgi:hypothetical protein